MLKCLPEAVQEKLRSGQTITSLQQCVEELVLNSIDAEASCVGVRVDLDAFKVQVIDNGTGMKEEDMEAVGNRYHTSKCSCVEDLENLRWFGFRGEALASIVSLASLVELSSRSKSSAKTQVKVFKNGHGLSLREAETTRPSAGTTVIVCNFLYNMPVRRKRMDAVLEAERIRHRVEAISLMHPLVSFTLKNDLTGAMTVQLPKARNTYHRFVQIHGLGRAQKLRDVGHTRGHFEVCGHISREGHYNSSLQFLYVNRRLLLKTRIHKVLNHLLRRLSSGQRHDDPGVRSPKHKNQELYGVYVINIKCPYSEYDICLEPAKTLIEFKDWDAVLLCVEEAVRAFLSRENLVSQDDVDLKSPKLFTNSPDQEEHNGGQATSSSVPTLDDIGTKLASEPVHRKRKDNQECEGETGLQEEQAMTVDEEEKLESDGGINGKFRSEPLDGLEPVSDGHLTEEEDPGRQESGKPETSEDIEPPLNTTTPSLTNNKQIFTGLQALDTYRKISLMDPYVHESLLTQEVNKLPQIFERSFASKRKISLNPGRDVWPIATSKIQRISACEKTFLCKESGSLEKFRRIYGKSDQLKFQQSAKPPQTDGFVPKSQNLKVCQDDGGDATTQNILQIPTASKPKPNSLAAKLYRLKQHRTDDSRLSNPNPNPPHLSTTSQDGSGSRSNEDTNNNNTENPENPENPEPASGLWLHHYDSSVGKTVYVNKVTGLSRYHDPPAHETQARCTSDVTNVAVAVVTETGMEYTCYPFQVELVLPFLPKSRTDRVISAGLDDGDATEESSNSLKSLYSKWNNPVFVRPPTVAVDVSSGRADGLAVKIHNILFPYRFSKAMIHTMKVIHQVDKKFLACLINTREEEPAAGAEPEGNLLVLVDQHAAHERVRLENLVADSYEDDPETPGERRLSSSNVVPPLKISVTEEEQRLLSSCQAHLQSLGLEVKFLQGAEPHLLVGKVPLCFIEKESNELRRGRPSVIKPVVEEYLREQIELLRSAGRVRGSLPLTVLKVLASLACHGAIKFNDSLSRDECCSLVASLSSCQLPFQCAHGRPSIAPLVDTRHLDQDPKDSQKPNLHKLRRMYKSWKLYGNG